ncbi:FitA-like ribbon-helix-helix domain-containing protein [Paralcaligenes ureilyticus]|uniref:FitA-like ribbon-helix-helix domain-containing protein n=1 Tax=Paralcaligenes ureilyticus TaxID=627131 RepID=UPI003C7EC1C1
MPDLSNATILTIRNVPYEVHRALRVRAACANVISEPLWHAPISAYALSPANNLS